MENEVGSIEVGKWANFVILDKNPLKIDPLNIKDVKIQQTIYKGGLFQT